MSKLDMSYDILKKVILDQISTSKYRSSNSIWATEPLFIEFVKITSSYITDESMVENWFNNWQTRNYTSPYTGYKDINENNYSIGNGGVIKISFDVKIGNQKHSDIIYVFYNDYLPYIRDNKLKSIGVTTRDKISNRLTEYLGFNSDDIFPRYEKIKPLVRVFGGAIRDILNDDPINDVDILCGSKYWKVLEDTLRFHGYNYIESLTPKDLSSIYSDIHVINEPHSWVKGNQVVQVIRPSMSVGSTMGVNTITSDIYERTFKDLIGNVDISCCGVSYDGTDLYENYPDAINHILNKCFIVNKYAKMYSSRRIIHRKQKFYERGWKEVDIDKVEDIRDLRIKSVLNNFNDYVVEHPVIKNKVDSIISNLDDMLADL